MKCDFYPIEYLNISIYLLFVFRETNFGFGCGRHFLVNMIRIEQLNGRLRNSLENLDGIPTTVSTFFQTAAGNRHFFEKVFYCIK